MKAYKNHLKRILAMAMAICNLIGVGALGVSTVASTEEVCIYGMTVNNFTDPIGIDTAAPTFGWKLQSDTVGQKQTAYQLVIAADEALSQVIWDSGKVESNDTTDIPYTGDRLADCTRYYWQVTVYDMNGIATTSDVAWFETAFITGTLLDGAQWIEVTEGGAQTTTTVNYTLDMDVISVTKAVGVLFGTAYKAADQTIMWQIQDKDGYYQLVPYYYGYNASNKLTWLTTGDAVRITADSIAYEAMKDGFHLQIRVQDHGIMTYVDNVLVATHKASDLDCDLALGFVGLREASNEGAVLDNITITDYLNNENGAVLATFDFADMEGGVLTAVSDESNNNWYGESTFVSGLKAASKRTVDYTIDVDVLSITGAFGLVFGDAKQTADKSFMWQIQDKTTSFKVAPHYYATNWKGYGTAAVIAEGDAYTAMADGFHLQLHITDDAVKTYVDGTLVHTLATADFGYVPSLGVVGVRGATGEWVTLDNVKVTDYLNNAAGVVLAEVDFSAKPSTMTNSNTVVENGIFSMVSGSYFGIDYFAEGLTPAAGNTTVTPVVNTVHYTYEADVACSSVAASLCFNMKDASNFLMWQIGLTDTAVELRPHQVVNGKYTTISKIDITAFVTPEEVMAGVHVKVEVTDTAILTYIDGELINVFDTSVLSVELFCNKFGIRIATNEDFTLDNVKAVNYFETEADGVLFEHTFETINPFFRGTLSEGKLVLDSDKDIGVSIIHNGTATFRKAFSNEKTVEKARLYITSYGLFSAYLNGERVGNKNADGEIVYDELAPGWTDQNYRTCYYTYDVTAYLADGENTLTVGVNYGWTGISLYYSNEPKTPHKLLAKMVITYTDGTTAIVGTDDTWDTAYVGPIISGDIFQGEYYDATADISYRLNGYDTSAWAKATAVTFDTTLTSRVGGQIYVRKDLERVPQSVTVYDSITDAVDGTQYGKVNVTATYGDETFTLKAGETAIVDFGQNFAGWENITFAGAKGTKVRIRHAEMLNDDLGLISRGNDGPEGSVYIANLRNAPATTHYVMSGAQSESYHPTVTYYGFRYVEITASADITVTKVRGEVLSSITEEVGSFKSSDALLNQLYSNILWGQRSNYFGQATDCPQRDERLGYSGDAQVFSQTAMYNADVKAFMYNFMQTLVEGQADDGGFGMVMPQKYASGAAYAGIAGFADAGIIVPYIYYRQYGDAAFLAEYYDAMVAYMEYLAAAGAERPNQKYGDWLAYEGTITDYISYVYTIWDAQMMQEIAAALGKTEDVAKWAAMEVTHKGYFRDKFLDENGDLTTTTQAAYLFALKLGLYESQEAWQRGKEALVEKIKSNGNKLSTGFMGTSIIMETLVEIGEEELAYALLFQEENPSWLFSVKQGATTVWERWNSYSVADGFGPVSMNSFNHYALGSVGAYLYKTVLGIQPDEAGYTKVLLEPVTTEKLTFASGSYDSVNGLIESAWKLDTNGRYTYDFTVPMNVTATVRLEKQAYASDYYVNGVAAADTTLENGGAVFLKEEDGYVYFEVVSGKFTFTCEAIPPLSAEKSSENGTFAFSVAGLSEYNGGYTANSNKNWYAFPATDTAVTTAITGNFHMYYNRENVYMQREDVTATDLDDADTYAGSTAGDSRWILLYDNYLQRKTSKTSGEKMRKIDSLVPIRSDGGEIILKNFETTFDIRFESDTRGAALLGFRQQTPGKFVDKLWTLNKSQAFVAIGRGGINIAGGNDIVSGNGTTGDMYNNWQTDTFDELLPQEVSVKVRVVGNGCEVWIYKINTTEQLKYYKVDIPYEDAGAIAYGVSTVGHDIGDFKLTRLDENGEIADIFTEEATDISHLPYSHGNITVEYVEKTETGYKYTVTVTPKDGYELCAGSLIVTDAVGNAYVPTRVGFRQGGDATQYTIETAGGGTVCARFIKPCTATPNIGNVGTSINTESDGVRFVSRFTRITEDDKEYVVLDGKKYEITDYGMLLGLATVIGDGELTAETAAANKYVKQISVKDSGIYYDVCDAYIDMSVCIIGIDSVAQGADMKITARGYVKAVIDGQETVLYGAPFTASYNDHF